MITKTLNKTAIIAILIEMIDECNNAIANIKNKNMLSYYFLCHVMSESKYKYQEITGDPDNVHWIGTALKIFLYNHRPTKDLFVGHYKGKHFRRKEPLYPSVPWWDWDYELDYISLKEERNAIWIEALTHKRNYLVSLLDYVKNDQANLVVNLPSND